MYECVLTLNNYINFDVNLHSRFSLYDFYETARPLCHLVRKNQLVLSVPENLPYRTSQIIKPLSTLLTLAIIDPHPSIWSNTLNVTLRFIWSVASQQAFFGCFFFFPQPKEYDSFSLLPFKMCLQATQYLSLCSGYVPVITSF